jgi:hypothetical protein
MLLFLGETEINGHCKNTCCVVDVAYCWHCVSWLWSIQAL